MTDKMTRQQDDKMTRQQDDKTTRQQDNKMTRQQDDKDRQQRSMYIDLSPSTAFYYLLLRESYLNNVLPKVLSMSH
ncbi:hypothetical protein KGF56_000902 [Candida oxycetoniae]|uniref:Uncharacterized protein n=1 Tax=Candida oxycetoniae TaxID=497107 RepID=A0AAI9T1B2_9ASCO|nr:uncharacterized protein KGF56_000902 [Candida oxycetoniae]KAI3406421.2 hypothetical protein KGF56_000902 [Candida oxycetoniae]